MRSFDMTTNRLLYLDIIKIRTRMILILLLLGFPCIILRLFMVQVVQHADYAEDAARNLDRFKELPPMRGAIYDRNHVLLAKTAPSYDVYIQLNNLVITPDSEADSYVLNEESIQNFYELMQAYEIPLSLEEIKKRVDVHYKNAKKNIQQRLAGEQELKKNQLRKYKKKKIEAEKDFFGRKYPLNQSIPAEAAQIITHDNVFWDCNQGDKVKIVDRYSGFCIGNNISRFYPEKDLACHLLGNMGPIPDNMRQYLIEEKDYHINDKIGLSGIERLCETELRGRRGSYVYSKQGIFYEEALDGQDVILTISAAAQHIAEQELDKMTAKAKSPGGAAVVIDIHTGEILVLASSPRFDNNQRQQINNTYNEEERALIFLNRAISRRDATPPGSVFKISTALYGLDHGFIDTNTYFDCRGYLHTPGKFRCTHHHGSVEIVKAIEGSCNVFFYQVGERMGYDHLIECSKIFGYGSKSGLGLREENAGLLPPRGTVGDNRFFGIGQRIEATPIQVARAMAMVAREGELPQLKIIKHVSFPAQLDTATDTTTNDSQPAVIVSTWHTNPRNWALVKDGMRKVTEGQDGTAKDLQKSLGTLRIASKTGTSEVTNEEDHGWFAGYAPLDNPQYAFAVFIEHGGYGGTVSGPVAVEILKALLVPQQEER